MPRWAMRHYQVYLLGFLMIGSLACKKKEKDEPASGGTGSGLYTDNRVSFQANGRTFTYTPFLSYKAAGFGPEYIHSTDTLIVGSDTIEFVLDFPLPTSRTDTSYQLNARNDVVGGEFRVVLYPARKYYITSARHGNRYSRLDVQLRISSGNIAQGTFSGLLYNYWEASDSVRITNGEFRLRF
ncbi:MAG: hypothetical protein ABDH66_02130 [Bacteroidia bacterium]